VVTQQLLALQVLEVLLLVAEVVVLLPCQQLVEQVEQVIILAVEAEAEAVLALEVQEVLGFLLLVVLATMAEAEAV
jgi:hypothetical protein